MRMAVASFKQVEDNILLSGDGVLPARCSPGGWCCLPQVRDRGLPSEGWILAQVSLHPRPIACHDMRQGQPARADLWTNTPRRQNRHQLHYPTPHLFTRTSRNGAAIRPT
jgi:hypothetical protein